MKRVVSVILAAIMVFAMAVGFTGCKKEENVLIMATNAQFPPYEYYEGEKIVGIDVEIAQAIATELGMKLRIEDVEFGSIISGVQTGKYDMGVAGMTVKPDRLESVNFSESYATGVQVVIVKADSNVNTLDDLSLFGPALQIGVQQDTTGDIYSTEDFGEDAVVRYNKGADAVQALVTGKVHCVIIDNEPAKAFVEANKGLKILETEYAVEDYAICVAKENTELLSNINAAIAKLKESGELQKIIDKYIPAK